MIRKRRAALVADRLWFDAALTAGHLKNAGYDVTVCHDGQEAYERLLDPAPCAGQRRRVSTSPSSWLYPAPGENGQQAPPRGAISKPLRGAKLLSMVRGLRYERRREPAKATRIRLGALSIDFGTHAATGADAASIQLSAEESGMLQYLAHRHGRAVPLTEIKTKLGIAESIPRFLFELRWKLGDNAMSRHLRPVGSTACRLEDFEVLA